MTEELRVGQEIESLLGGCDQELLGEDAARPTLNQGARMVELLGSRAGGMNVIPGGKPGSCHPVLIVALGAQEDAEPRILQAVEHLHVRCKGVTRSLVFWAAWWDPRAWVRHRESFKGVRVALRMIGMPTIPIA